MKKWVLQGLALIVLSVVICVGLVGCSDTGTRDVQGYEVSEEQWNAALSALSETTDFAMELSINAEATAELDFTYGGGQKQSGGYTRTRTVRGTKIGDNEHIFTDEEASISGDMKFISEFSGLDLEEIEKRPNELYVKKLYDSITYTAYNVYSKDANGKWQVDSSYGYVGLSYYRSLVVNMLPSSSYDYYEYNQSERGYVPKTANNSDTENTSEYVIKFDKIGRISAIWIHTTSNDYSVNKTGYPYAETESTESFTNIIFSYDNLEAITLPTVSEQDK